MSCWEYDEEFAGVGDSWTGLLDKRGRDGWELVAVVDDEEDDYRLVFKRRVASRGPLNAHEGSADE